MPTATDAVDPAPSVVCTPASGSTFAIGTTPVTCTATDASDNSASASFTVTVQDKTPPVITVPATITVQATSAAGAVVAYSPLPSATDLVAGNVGVTCSKLSGSTFAVGSTTVTCSATDGKANTATKSFTVTVTPPPATPPKLTLPANITADATSTSGAKVTYTATAKDAAGKAITPKCTPASNTTFPVGITTVNCTAADSKGVSASGSFTVQVRYAWSNVLSPIKPDGSSVFLLRNVIPVKFQLTGGSAPITNLKPTLSWTQLSSSTGVGPVTSIEILRADTGNTFRYEPLRKQYQFNLSTTTFARGVWRLTIDLKDGVTHSVNITLR